MTLPNFKKANNEVDSEILALSVKDNDPDVNYVMSIFENKASNSPFVEDYKDETFSYRLVLIVIGSFKPLITFFCFKI